MSTTTAYDPVQHDNQIVAMYDTDTQAHAARDALISGGVSADTIQVVARGGDLGMTDDTQAQDMWSAVRSLFIPDSERAAYSHAVGHGHAILVVTVMGGADRGNVIHVLEGTNPVDFDAKLQDWTSSGYDHSTPHADYLASTQGSMTATTTSPAAGGTDHDTSEATEERLRVGKREVADGAVRVRSYIVERPVKE